MANDGDDWKPNGRPQSTIARNFSASLNDAFAIVDDSNLHGLVQSVEQKKQAVSSQSQELQALEARLKETEERLKRKKAESSAPAGSAGGNSPHRRQPLGNAFAGQQEEEVRSNPAAESGMQATAAQGLSASTKAQWMRASQEGGTESGGGVRTGD